MLAHIGFVGIGVMGSRMAKRLIEAEFPVTVYNRTAGKADPLVQLGASRAATIGELAEKADIICTCLSMPEDVRQVYSGSEGIFSKAKTGTVCLDFTTVGRDVSIQLALEAEASLMDYMDTPVSGGPEGAEQGTLTIMAGGKEAAFQTCLPILKQLGSNVQYLGESGRGSVAKLINQYLVAVHSLAAAEAMVTGSAYGIDPEQLYHILKTSYGESRMLRRHVEQHILDRNFEPGGALKYLLKDVKLANKLVAAAGLPTSTGIHAEAALQTAAGQELGDLDMSAIILPLEQQAGIKVKTK